LIPLFLQTLSFKARRQKEEKQRGDSSHHWLTSRGQNNKNARDSFFMGVKGRERTGKEWAKKRGEFGERKEEKGGEAKLYSLAGRCAR